VIRVGGCGGSLRLLTSGGRLPGLLAVEETEDFCQVIEGTDRVDQLDARPDHIDLGRGRDIVRRYAVDLAPMLLDVVVAEPDGRLGRVIGDVASLLDAEALDALADALPKQSVALIEAADGVSAALVALGANSQRQPVILTTRCQATSLSWPTNNYLDI
jgi:hypothetical protein